jgi:hypothetical protein
MAKTRESEDVDTGSDNATKMLKHWLGRCVLEHPNCKHPERRDEENPVLLTRVIDVGPPDGSMEPRLYVTEG